MPTCVFCERENPESTTQCQNCGAQIPGISNQGICDVDLRSGLLKLLDQGDKVRAIAAYRRLTNASLPAAVEFIDALDHDREFAIPCPIADVEREAGKLLERGEKINAVKLYRDRTGLGLKEAKDEVEALERRLGLLPGENTPASGCAGVLLLFSLASYSIATLLTAYIYA